MCTLFYGKFADVRSSDKDGEMAAGAQLCAEKKTEEVLFSAVLRAKLTNALSGIHEATSSILRVVGYFIVNSGRKSVTTSYY